MYTILLIFIIIISIYTRLYYLSIHHKNYKKRKEELTHSYHTNTIINITISICVFAFIVTNSTFSNHLIPRLDIIFIYLILSDTFYYWLHRIIHRTPILKQALHSTHHSSRKLIPLDMFYVEHKEFVCYLLLTLGLKGLFSQINLLEYCLVSSIMFYHTYYTHAEIKEPFFLPLFIDSSFHKKHHTIGGGNYGLFLNIWDKYMGTTIKKKKIV